MIIHKASAESAKTANTAFLAFAAIRHCSPCWHKMIARAWQVGHSSPDDQQQARTGYRDAIEKVMMMNWPASRPWVWGDEWYSGSNEADGQRFFVNPCYIPTNWRPRGFPILYPIPRSVGERDRSPPLSTGYWPAFVSVFMFISTNQSGRAYHLLTDPCCSDHV
jgi:hypothetical protein